MREIKFRVWNEEENKMEFVGAIDWDYKERIITCNTTTTTKLYALSNNHLKIMQYTGLKDKNGKEIYEGDIVIAWSQGYCGKFEIRWREDGGGSPKWLLYPAWQNREIWGISASRETDGQIYDNGLEIIGNIYENPELLEE